MRVEVSARSVLIALVSLVALQLFQILPGIEYIAGSFPTYFHRLESLIILCILFVSLMVIALSKGCNLYKVIALIWIGALMFYSGYHSVTTFYFHSNSAAAKWALISAIMTLVLFWVIITAIQNRYYAWRDLFFSVLIMLFGLFYLNLVGN